MTLVLPKLADQPVDWKVIDDAVFCWATERLELEGVWENQNIPQPCYPYLSLLRHDEIDEGGVDERRWRTLDSDGREVGPGSGAAYENEEISYQPIQFTVTIQAHVDFDAGATESRGEAKRLLGILKRALWQTSTQDALKAAGLSVIRAEAVQDLSLVINGDWVSRAAMDVIFRTASVITERVGFIEHVELKSEQLGIDTVVDAT